MNGISSNVSCKGLNLQNQIARSEDIQINWERWNTSWWNWYVSLSHHTKDLVDNGSLIFLPDIAFTSTLSIEALKQELAEPYPLADHHIEQFQSNGYVRLKDVLSPEAVYLLRQESGSILDRLSQSKASQKVISAEMVWLENAVIREFTLSHRLARIATELLDVSGVFSYQNALLCKEPGCGRTPWHYDLCHYPAVTKHVCSTWLPLQGMPWEMGIIELACGMDVYQMIAQVSAHNLEQTYDHSISKLLQSSNIKINCEPFEVGEMSFHHGFNVHSAAANRTNQRRLAISNIYFEGKAYVDELVD